MKIVFAGTPSFSVFHLNLLLKSRNEVAAVLTQPDRRSGRGNELRPSPVKILAEKEKISTFQPQTLKNNNEIIRVLNKINPDLILVVAYGLIVPKKVLILPKLGCINVHASLLPKWRGGAPIERTILEGDSEGGITFMKMDEGLDTGPIMKMIPCSLDKEENSETLEIKYQDLSRTELIKFLESLSKGEVDEIKQDSSLATYAEKITTQETEILWDQHEAEYIQRKVRALFPKYGAFTFLGRKRIKILRAEEDINSYQLSPGEILISSERSIHVGCKKNTSLMIQQLQLEGKLPTKGEDFLRGNKNKILRLKKFSSSALENK